MPDAAPGFCVKDVFNLPPICALRQLIRLRHQPHREAVKSLPGSAMLSIWSLAETCELNLFQFPHALAAAFDALCRLEAAQANLAQSRISRGPSKPGQIEMILNDEEAYAVNFAIDTFLEAAVRSQDGALGYVSRIFGLKNPPDSLRTAVERLKKASLRGIPAKVCGCIVDYWERGGRQLRDYRVLSQHYGVVTSDLRLYFAADDQPLLYLALPSRPEVQRPAKFIYDSPIVLAFPFCSESFLNLLRWIFTLAELIAPREFTALSGAPHFLTPPLMVDGRFNGYPVGRRGDFAAAVSQLVQQQLVNHGDAVGRSSFVWQMVNRIPER
jgi:hypothetical protein